jgi:hypothetical protein
MPYTTKELTGRLCGGDNCGNARLVLQHKTGVYPWKVAGNVVKIRVENVPVAVCPRCKEIYRGTDTEQYERDIIGKAVDQHWYELLAKAGASPAHMIKLKMVFLKAVAEFPQLLSAAGELGRWLATRPKKEESENGQAGSEEGSHLALHKQGNGSNVRGASLHGRPGKGQRSS